MLTKIIVKQLFGLYDYDIDLKNDDGSMAKFVTAPNGYGKTTLLDFVYGVMTAEYAQLFAIPFQEFQLFYTEDDHNTYRISISRSVHQNEQDEKSDEIEEETVKLDFFLTKGFKEESELIESFSLTKSVTGEVEKDGMSENTDMFFMARTCHYITDRRLLNVKTEFGNETLYLQNASMKAYADDMKRILVSPTLKKEYGQRIETFKRIIDCCDYAHKQMEIDDRFGIRFVADDEMETKLSLDNLSSGEKHMLLQVYELLFKAQQDTLVLIDEPELSLHMMWQMNYLKNIEEIISVRGFQCIVATHSPQIFNSMWSKSIDLFSIASSTEN